MLFLEFERRLAVTISFFQHPICKLTKTHYFQLLSYEYSEQNGEMEGRKTKHQIWYFKT